MKKSEAIAPHGLPGRPIWRCHADGSYDLEGFPVGLRRAYPALDYCPLRALSVKLEGCGDTWEIRYGLPGGRSVLLRLSVEEGLPTLRSSLEGFAQAPHWFHPLGGAEVVGADRLFRQGVGFSGPTNVVPLDPLADPFSYESYLITGLIGKEGEALVLAARRTDRFQQKTEVFNRLHRANFRNRVRAAGSVLLEAGFSMERIPLPAEGVELPALYVHSGAEAWGTLRESALAIGQVCGARLPPPTCHWCSWYERASFLTCSELIDFLEGAKSLSMPLHAVQIDDGYCEAHGDWLIPNRKWPGGLERAFREIRARGYAPGIWIAPYMVESRSRLYAEHPDWVLRDLEGRPVTEWKSYNGTRYSEEYYVLDTSHPGAFSYLREVLATMRGWGAVFFKTDFVEWGHKDSTTVRRHTPGKTSAEYHHDVCRMIRETLGEEAYWLGCIAFFAPYIGMVDGMRVSSDVGVDWGTSGGTGNDGVGGGTGNVVSEILASQYFNYAFWQNDPDALILREYHQHYRPGEAETLALLCGILGVSINTSDRFDRFSAARLALWRFLRPQATPWTARLPFHLSPNHKMTVAVRDFPGLAGQAVLFVNTTGGLLTEVFPVSALVPGWERAHAFRWGPFGSEAEGERDHFCPVLEAHQSVLYYLSPDGVPPPADLSLGGWRPMAGMEAEKPQAAAK